MSEPLELKTHGAKTYLTSAVFVVVGVGIFGIPGALVLQSALRSFDLCPLSFGIVMLLIGVLGVLAALQNMDSNVLLTFDLERDQIRRTQGLLVRKSRNVGRPSDYRRVVVLETKEVGTANVPKYRQQTGAPETETIVRSRYTLRLEAEEGPALFLGEFDATDEAASKIAAHCGYHLERREAG